MRRIASGVLILILTGCSGPTLRTPQVDSAVMERERAIQMEMAERLSRDSQIRVQRVLSPLTRAGVDLCGQRTAFIAGFEDKVVYQDADPVGVNIARNVWGISDQGPTIVDVAPGGSAEKAGLTVGDVILSVNGQIAGNGRDAVAMLKKHMAPARETGSALALKVDRSGVTHEVTVLPERKCDTPSGIIIDDTVNAFAKPEGIWVTTGMLKFVNGDDELAVVLGHEMAHHILDHLSKQERNRFWGALLGGMFGAARLGAQQASLVHSQDFEKEADVMGLYLAARAGFDVSQAPQLWRRMAVSHPAAIHAQGGTHPSTVERFALMDAVVAEIAAKKAAGLPLVPEMKP